MSIYIFPASPSCSCDRLFSKRLFHEKYTANTIPLTPTTNAIDNHILEVKSRLVTQEIPLLSTNFVVHYCELQGPPFDRILSQSNPARTI